MPNDPVSGAEGPERIGLIRCIANNELHHWWVMCTDPAEGDAAYVRADTRDAPLREHDDLRATPPTPTDPEPRGDGAGGEP
jgi:hypothetical protein